MNALFETIDGSVFIARVADEPLADEITLGRRHFYRCYGNTAPLLYSESIAAALHFPYRMNLNATWQNLEPSDVPFQPNSLGNSDALNPDD